MKGAIDRYDGKRGTVYRLRVDVGSDPATGKRQFVTERIKGTRREADKRLRELIAEIETGVHVAPSATTVGDLLDRWFEAVSQTVRETTAEGYKTYLRAYLKTRLGQIRLQELTPALIEAAYTTLQRSGGKGGRPLSRRTLHHAHRTLSEALAYGVRANLIARNPADRVTAPRFDRKEIRVLEPAEMSAVFGYLREHTPWAYWPTALTLLTGLRRSETLALQWRDVHINGASSSLSVRRSFARLTTGEEVIRPPKTARSARNVALGARAVELLQELRAHRAREADLLDRTVSDTDWLFADALGNVHKPHSLSQAFRRACRACGVEGATFHGLRHTHATGLLRANIHPAVVQQRLGHSTIATTVDLYSHVTPGLQERAAERFDEAFGSTLPALPADTEPK